jgi:arylesterase/paraoxonase
MYDLAAKTNDEKPKDPVATELKIVSKTLDFKGFNPHGIAVYVDKGTTHLYVINHDPKGDVIERFTFEKDKKQLTHTKSIKHPTIFAANNLVMIGLDKFYVTNDHYFKHKYMMKLEMLTLAALGSIVYYDGTTGRVVDQWLLSPNGINADKARKQLYVSLIWSKSVRIYDVKGDGNITAKRDIKLHTCTDNLFVDQETGDIWSGAHPVMHEAGQHLDNPKTRTAPSQVIRIRLAKKDGENDYISEPYSNDGSVLSGTSAAARFKNQLLIGTVYHKMLLCDILDPELI